MRAVRNFLALASVGAFLVTFVGALTTISLMMIGIIKFAGPLQFVWWSLIAAVWLMVLSGLVALIGLIRDRKNSAW